MLGRLQIKGESEVILFQFGPVLMIGIKENILSLMWFFDS